MFDIGWSELLIIGVVALIVIGPKDLPEMFRTLGRFTAKLRSISRDFQRAMEAAAKDSGVTEIARDVKNMASPKNLGLDAVRNAADRFEKWDPLKPSTGPKPSPAAGPGSDVPAETPAPATAPSPASMGPATAALAAAKARERAAALAGVGTKIAPHPISGASGTVPALPASATDAPTPAARTPRTPKAAKAVVGAAPAKPVTARTARAKATKGAAPAVTRKARKAPPEGDDA